MGFYFSKDDFVNVNAEVVFEELELFKEEDYYLKKDAKKSGIDIRIQIRSKYEGRNGIPITQHGASVKLHSGKIGNVTIYVDPAGTYNTFSYPENGDTLGGNKAVKKYVKNFMVHNNNNILNYWELDPSDSEDFERMRKIEELIRYNLNTYNYNRGPGDVYYVDPKAKDKKVK